MKRYLSFIPLLLCASASCGETVITKAGTTTKLGDYIQDGLSRLGGKAYVQNTPSDQRVKNVQQAIFAVRETCRQNEGVYWYDCVDKGIQDAMIKLSKDNIKQTCRQNQFTPSQAQAIANQVETDLIKNLEQRVDKTKKFGLPEGAFANCFGNNAIYEIQRANKKVFGDRPQYNQGGARPSSQPQQPQPPRLEPQEDNSSSGLAFAIGVVLGYFFGSSDNNSTTQQPPRPEPSAPPAPVSQATQPTFFQQQQDTHCPVCLEDYGDVDDSGRKIERVYLPCRHAHCQNCTNDMFLSKAYPEPCTTCRKTPTKQSLQAVDRAAHNAHYCCSCGMHENNMEKVGNCAHKVCGNCKAGWKKTDACDSCPKCTEPAYRWF